VIDLIHVLEYLWKAAWSLHAAGDPAAEDWVAVKALAVLAGDSAPVAQDITAEVGTAGLAGSQRNGADTCVHYLSAKEDYLPYDRALAAGWPIATGVIEGACRHLIGDRLDIGGARWGLDGAEAVLTLRGDQHRRLRRILALPPRSRALAALPRHETRPVHARGLTHAVTRSELHPIHSPIRPGRQPRRHRISPAGGTRSMTCPLSAHSETVGPGANALARPRMHELPVRALIIAVLLLLAYW